MINQRVCIVDLDCRYSAMACGTMGVVITWLLLAGAASAVEQLGTGNKRGQLFPSTIPTRSMRISSFKKRGLTLGYFRGGNARRPPRFPRCAAQVNGTEREREHEREEG